MPIIAEEAVGDGGADGVGDMAVQGVAAVGDDHHIGRVLDLDDLVPRVIHEAVVVLIGRQVAVAVGHHWILLLARGWWFLIIVPVAYSRLGRVIFPKEPGELSQKSRR